MAEASLYEVLGVASSAGQEEIREKYRELVRSSHPDKTGDSQDKDRFLMVQKAWETLRDPERRSAYDRERAWLASTRLRWSEEVHIADMDIRENDDDPVLQWPCRCGGFYFIRESEVDDGVDVVVPCSSCSLRVRVVED